MIGLGKLFVPNSKGKYWKPSWGLEGANSEKWPSETIFIWKLKDTNKFKFKVSHFSRVRKTYIV